MNACTECGTPALAPTDDCSNCGEVAGRACLGCGEWTFGERCDECEEDNVRRVARATRNETAAMRGDYMRDRLAQEGF